MMEIILAGVVSLVITLAAGKLLIPALIRLKAGQSIKEVGPTWHKGKQGTPTMGGLMFIIGIGIAILILGWKGMLEELHPSVCLCVRPGVRRHRLYRRLSEGEASPEHRPHRSPEVPAAAGGCRGLPVPDALRGYAESQPVYPLLQHPSGAAVGGVYDLRRLRHHRHRQRREHHRRRGRPVLQRHGACGCVFAVLGGLWQGFGQLGVFAGALVGGLLGFLFYNHYPAKVFMGDTGSLFLGGAVAALAFAYDMPLILLLVGFVYLCETLSDIIQVTYFKLTHGKRIFKMAPLHHHFEMCGWKETKVVAVFAAVSTIFCVLAYLGVMDRFGA